MTDIQKSIDKLTDKISELEAQLHVANESLEAQANEINYLRENKVNYDAIQAWVTEEYGKKVEDMIKESFKFDSKLSKSERGAELKAMYEKVKTLGDLLCVFSGQSYDDLKDADMDVKDTINHLINSDLSCKYSDYNISFGMAFNNDDSIRTDESFKKFLLKHANDKVLDIEVKDTKDEVEINATLDGWYDKITLFTIQDFFEARIKNTVKKMISEAKKEHDIKKLLNGPVDDTNVDESKVQSIVKDYFIESIAPKVQDWITEEYSSEVKDTVKDYFIESIAPKVQDWITEEYSSEVKNTVKDYFIESIAPKVQDWIVEEYSQTLDNFIKESQSELSEEITESLNERINEAKKEINSNVSEFLESQKRGQFDKFDTMLEKLSESNEAAKFEALNSLNEGREDYANVYAVKNMPLQYQPMWESLSTEKRADVVRSSRMYNFSKPGVLESFWANQFKTGNVQNALINESLSQNKPVVNNRYAGLFARAKKMQLR